METINILQYGDYGKQVDDELALLAALGYESAGLARLVGVIGTYAGAEKRARLARSMLDALGQQHVPVGCGEDPLPFPYPDYEIDSSKPESYEFYTIYPTSTALLPTAKEIAGQVLERAADNSITIELQSPMADVAQLLDNEPELTKRKLAQMVIQAGVLADANGPILSARGFLQPENSYNVACAPEAAAYVYEELQGRGIPASFVGSKAVRDAIWTDTHLFTSLKILSPVGLSIDIRDRKSFERNLREVSQELPDQLLRPNITREQFLEREFQSPDDIPDYFPEEVWDMAHNKTHTCDSLAVATCIPSVVSEFMTPLSYTINNSPYRVIGLNDATPALRCAGKLRHHLHSMYLNAGVAYNGSASISFLPQALRDSKWAHIYRDADQKSCPSDCDHNIPEAEDADYDDIRKTENIRDWVRQVQKQTKPVMKKLIEKIAVRGNEAATPGSL